MVKDYRTPTGLGDMAGITLRRGAHMPGRFTRGSGPIVTTRAVAADAAMVKDHRIPTGLGDMTGITLRCGIHMP